MLGLFVDSVGPPVAFTCWPTDRGLQAFTKAGTYEYICTVHDDMTGTVVVGNG